MKQNCVCEPDVTQAQLEELIGSEEVIMTQKKRKLNQLRSQKVSWRRSVTQFLMRRGSRVRWQILKKGLSAEWLLVNYSTRSEKRDLLGEALCDGVVFSPGRDDGHLFGGDPQRLGRPLPAAERSDGGHVCCTSERSICLVGVALEGTRVVTLRGHKKRRRRRKMLSQVETKQKGKRVLVASWWLCRLLLCSCRALKLQETPFLYI